MRTGRGTERVEGKAGGFSQDGWEALVFSASRLGVRGLSLRFIYCETGSSS